MQTLWITIQNDDRLTSWMVESHANVEEGQCVINKKPLKGQQSNKLNNRVIGNKNKFSKTRKNLWGAPIKIERKIEIKNTQETQFV